MEVSGEVAACEKDWVGLNIAPGCTAPPLNATELPPDRGGTYTRQHPNRPPFSIYAMPWFRKPVTLKIKVSPGTQLEVSLLTSHLVWLSGLKTPGPS